METERFCDKSDLCASSCLFWMLCKYKASRCITALLFCFLTLNSPRVPIRHMENDGNVRRSLGKSTNQFKHCSCQVAKCKLIFARKQCPVSVLWGAVVIKNGCTRLKFHGFPRDDKIKWKWISVISLRTKDNEWNASHRVCSAHFHGGHLYGSKNIPVMFPRRDLKTGKVVWPIDISHLLVGKTWEEDQRNSAVSLHVPKVIEARDEIQMAPESRESRQTPAVFMLEDVVRKECEWQQEIDWLQERIRKLEEQRVVERFRVRRFMASDLDITFYTGLPVYQTFLCIIS